GLRDGFRWSPDGSAIAYWQLDTAGVREFPLVNNTDSLYPRITRIQYPKVGEVNAAGRVGVVSVAGGPTRWLEVPGDPRNHYIARLEWVGPGELVLQQLNRLQNTNRVMLADAGSGQVRTVFTDRDDAWIEVVDEMEWLSGGERFTWVSERDGWRHAYVVSRADGEARCVTPGDYDVTRLLRVDEEGGWVYFLASPENPTRRYLYRTSIDGGPPERVTPPDARGSHSYQISPDGRYAIHRASSFGVPSTVELVTLPGHDRVRVLEANERLRERVEKLARHAVEFFRVDIGDGVELDGWCMRPPDFDANRKYPLLVHVYGEPAGLTVLDRWGGSGYLWHLLLTQRGYVVMSFDNRGTPAPRGRAWRKSIYRQVGVLAPRDQAAAVRKVLETRLYLDRERVGVWGWSGGGSMSLNAIFKFPDLYHTAMSVAPVPNQRYYDTIYQERYMGLPADNVEGFREGSPINFARQLRGDLLLVHGTGDDNCHYQGTEALVNELVRHNKPFTLMAYPNRTHSIREGTNTTLHLRSLLTRYLLAHLPPGPRGQSGAAVAATPPAATAEKSDAPSREHVLREIEGWRVHVDRKLLEGDGAELGRKALKILAHELYEIHLRVPVDKLPGLRAVPIWIDLDHALGSMQYHPSAGWLRSHGHDVRMEKCFHIPRAKGLVDLQRTNHQPWVVLHELAHAYHDRVLGFDEPRIRKAYDRVVAAKIYEKVLLNRGKPTRHYALTNHKEFFAEMSESYFGANDFYPFVKAELRQHDPETHALLEEIWGKVP
ncbi:MAG: DPP IV N-terminal domain-containing protein, partial [Planctomycetota bacterium]|nr:DPP IV N-terminal domain-containing protein [Planctomycetota bacterium]